MKNVLEVLNYCQQEMKNKRFHELPRKIMITLYE